VLAVALGAAGGQSVLYAAENHNHAAEILSAALGPAAAPPGFQALNTVIGKMSGVIADPGEIEAARLAPLAPGIGRAALVEEFNRILVSRVTLPGFRRALAAFEEKEDLLPFEEAKLFGHNAIHCLLGFLARRRGYALMSQAAGDGELMGFAREAFILESGAGLLAKHRRVADPLFTEAGFAAYADDLLRRMVNPWLRDTVERVTRDAERKLAYGDRLFGAMRLALRAGVRPVRIAAAARAGVEHLAPGPLDGAAIRAILESIWSRGPREADGLEEECVRLVAEARPAGRGR
jgi:mannitol-1-phosphate 5-dehydrogenase